MTKTIELLEIDETFHGLRIRTKQPLRVEVDLEKHPPYEWCVWLDGDDLDVGSNGDGFYESAIADLKSDLLHNVHLYTFADSSTIKIDAQKRKRLLKQYFTVEQLPIHWGNK